LVVHVVGGRAIVCTDLTLPALTPCDGDPQGFRLHATLVAGQGGLQLQDLHARPGCAMVAGVAFSGMAFDYDADGRHRAARGTVEAIPGVALTGDVEFAHGDFQHASVRLDNDALVFPPWQVSDAEIDVDFGDVFRAHGTFDGSVWSLAPLRFNLQADATLSVLNLVDVGGDVLVSDRGAAGCVGLGGFGLHLHLGAWIDWDSGDTGVMWTGCDVGRVRDVRSAQAAQAGEGVTVARVRDRRRGRRRRRPGGHADRSGRARGRPGDRRGQAQRPRRAARGDDDVRDPARPGGGPLDRGRAARLGADRPRAGGHQPAAGPRERARGRPNAALSRASASRPGRAFHRARSSPADASRSGRPRRGSPSARSRPPATVRPCGPAPGKDRPVAVVDYGSVTKRVRNARAELVSSR
jgi:hypothetical protein